MQKTYIIFIVLVAVFVAVNVGFGFLERYLARKSRGMGTVLPAFFLIISVMTMLNSVEKSIKQIFEANSPLIAILVLIGVFAFINIPTIVTYAVFCKVRKGIEKSEK